MNQTANQQTKIMYFIFVPLFVERERGRERKRMWNEWRKWAHQAPWKQIANNEIINDKNHENQPIRMYVCVIRTLWVYVDAVKKLKGEKWRQTSWILSWFHFVIWSNSLWAIRFARNSACLTTYQPSDKVIFVSPVFSLSFGSDNFGFEFVLNFGFFFVFRYVVWFVWAICVQGNCARIFDICFRFFFQICILVQVIYIHFQYKYTYSQHVKSQIYIQINGVNIIGFHLIF